MIKQMFFGWHSHRLSAKYSIVGSKTSILNQKLKQKIRFKEISKTKSLNYKTHACFSHKNERLIPDQSKFLWLIKSRSPIFKPFKITMIQTFTCCGFWLRFGGGCSAFAGLPSWICWKLRLRVSPPGAWIIEDGSPATCGSSSSFSLPE